MDRLKMVINEDTKIKKLMSEKLDDMLQEMREYEVKSNKELLERNEKIMSVLDYETECINKLIEMCEDK